jgi:hypothetical protein
MPVKKYKCKNVAGGCEHAFTKDIIEIEEGVDFECPSKLSGCGAEEITGKKEVGPGWPMWKKAAVAVGAVAVLGGGTAALMHKTPCPDCADQMLTDIFGPGLKK